MALQGKTMASATIVAPEGMWFVGGAGQAFPMPPFGRPSLEQEFGRHPIALLRARRNPAFKAVALGTAQIDGVKVDEVRDHQRRYRHHARPGRERERPNTKRQPSGIETTRASTAL